MTVECKKCSMNENCMCIPSADECVIRKESYNKAVDDMLEKLSEYDDILSVIPTADLQGIICVIEQLKK